MINNDLYSVMIILWLVCDNVVSTVRFSLLKLVKFSFLFFSYLLLVLSLQWIKIIINSHTLRHWLIRQFEEATCTIQVWRYLQTKWRGCWHWVEWSPETVSTTHHHHYQRCHHRSAAAAVVVETWVDDQWTVMSWRRLSQPLNDTHTTTIQYMYL